MSTTTDEPTNAAEDSEPPLGDPVLKRPCVIQGQAVQLDAHRNVFLGYSKNEEDQTVYVSFTNGETETFLAMTEEAANALEKLLQRRPRRKEKIFAKILTEWIAEHATDTIMQTHKGQRVDNTTKE